MNSYPLYLSYIKPEWAPPSWLFGPVWSVLYVIIAVSFGYVGYLYFKKRLPFSVFLPFILNLGFNFAFTPIQFGLDNLPLAAIDILLVLVTIVWFMIAIWKHARWVALVNIPYLIWVTFATTLQLTILYLNS